MGLAAENISTSGIRFLVSSNNSEGLCTLLVPVANRWNTAMGNEVAYPSTHVEFLDRCHQAGQDKPTPLILKYGADDYNCLHQDLYGQHVFPVQFAILLSDPRGDFTGGEFVMTEQRPRMQSRPIIVPLRQGDGVLFAVHHRPVRGGRGWSRVTLWHGVSRIRSGHPLYGRNYFSRRQVKGYLAPAKGQSLAGRLIVPPISSRQPWLQR